MHKNVSITGGASGLSRQYALELKTASAKPYAGSVLDVRNEGIIDFVSRPQQWLENAEWYHLEDY